MDHIRALLQTGNLDKLIGMSEDLHLDAKRDPYDLSTAAGRYELAKDVSAFANAQGGFLIMGIATEREADAEIDTLTTFTPLDLAAFSAAKYRGVIGEYVYPAIVGMRIAFLAYGAANEGIGVIEVPRQHPDVGPFIIAKVVEDGAELKAIVAGLAIRQDSRSEPLSPKMLQQRLRTGSTSTAVRLASLEDKVDRLLEQPAGTDATEAPAVNRELLKSRLSKIFDEEE